MQTREDIIFILKRYWHGVLSDCFSEERINALFSENCTSQNFFLQDKKCGNSSLASLYSVCHTILGKKIINYIDLDEISLMSNALVNIFRINGIEYSYDSQLSENFRCLEEFARQILYDFNTFDAEEKNNCFIEAISIKDEFLTEIIENPNNYVDSSTLDLVVQIKNHKNFNKINIKDLMLLLNKNIALRLSQKLDVLKMSLHLFKKLKDKDLKIQSLDRLNDGYVLAHSHHY